MHVGGHVEVASGYYSLPPGRIGDLFWMLFVVRTVQGIIESGES